MNFQKYRTDLRLPLSSLLLILFTFVQPYSQQTNLLHESPLSDSIEVSAYPFYVLVDHEFKEMSLTKEPEMIGGKDLMETLIKLNIRYPDAAKEKKIGGTVLVSVVIDTLGKMEDVFIHEGVGGGCNDEALHAVRIMDKVGFTPGEINGRPVTVKFDIPITFLPR